MSKEEPHEWKKEKFLKEICTHYKRNFFSFLHYTLFDFLTSKISNFKFIVPITGYNPLVHYKPTRFIVMPSAPIHNLPSTATEIMFLPFIPYPNFQQFISSTLTHLACFRSSLCADNLPHR